MWREGGVLPASSAAARQGEKTITITKRVRRFVSIFGLLRGGWYPLLRAQIAIVQRRLAQRATKINAHAQLQAISRNPSRMLKLYAWRRKSGCNQIDGASRGGHAGRFGGKTCGHGMNVSDQ